MLTTENPRNPAAGKALAPSHPVEESRRTIVVSILATAVLDILAVDAAQGEEAVTDGKR